MMYSQFEEIDNVIEELRRKYSFFDKFMLIYGDIYALTPSSLRCTGHFHERLLKDHANRTLYLATQMTRELQDVLTPALIDHCHIAAFLHDIGKILLTPKDDKCAHALKGYKLLKQEGFPDTITLPVLRHMACCCWKPLTVYDAIVATADALASNPKIIIEY